MERSDWKRVRRETMAAAALEVFLEKGIDAATLDEVAQRAGVGIASVYRHFGTKADLAVAAAEQLWRVKGARFLAPEDTSPRGEVSGYRRAQQLLGHSLEVFDQNREVFGFLEAFDRYVVGEALEPSRLAGYDGLLLEFRRVLEETLVSGQRDGSIRKGFDTAVYCATFSRSFVALAEKIVNHPVVVPSDTLLSDRAELQMLVDWALAWLQEPLDQVGRSANSQPPAV